MTPSLLHADVAPPGGTASAPTLIDGVHNYCDRWCERCRFTERCVVFIECRRQKQAHPNRGPWEHAAATLRQTLALARSRADREGLDQRAIEAAAAQEAREMARVRRDPLVAQSERYTKTAYQLVSALERTEFRRTADRDAVVAVDAIAWFGLMISSKIYRAVHGAMHPDVQEEDPVQTDANGSAKIARLAIGESRDAWQVVLARGKATADAPVVLLERIDAALAERFPRAMEFVRPGFDTEAREVTASSSSV